MANQYGKFYCRVCGGQVFVPLALTVPDGADYAEICEFTCSNGHTDQYEISKVEHIEAKSPTKVTAKAACAATG